MISLDHCDPHTVIAKTEFGLVSGVRLGASWVFKGIPFASPPVGRLRWKTPRKLRGWTGVRSATGFGYIPMQTATICDPFSHAVGSEDCLTVNVFTPSLEPTGALPVLFFIHGGAHVTGASSLRWNGIDIYTGTHLAAAGIVVVTFNYRLGPLGFFAHPSLSNENHEHVSGNYAILDQIAALRWVRRNIANFGGHPGRITVLGHSSGASDALILIASPMTSGLFAQAILLSGHDTTTSHAVAEHEGLRLAQMLGIAKGECFSTVLRARSASELITAWPVSFTRRGINFRPVIDDWILSGSPVSQISLGRHNRMPVIIGNTAHEMTTLVQQYVPRHLTSDRDYHAALGVFLAPRLVEYAATAYRTEKYRSRHRALLAAITDYGFACSGREIARAFSVGQSEPAWRMVFSYSNRSGPLRSFGAGHGMELPFIFQERLGRRRAGIEDNGEKIAGQIKQYCVNFIKTGKPDGSENVVPWPRYYADSEAYLEIGANTVVKRGFRNSECDAWERAISRRRK